MKKIFITGTDTEVGKTLVSSILMMALKGCYWKPIQSGLADSISDVELVKQWANIPQQNLFPSVYSLRASLSPNQAAQLENVTIDLSKCVLPQTTQTLIVEGTGGLLVPLNENQLMIDLIEQFKFPVIIVAKGTLGTINHTLLTIDALRAKNIPLHGIVFSGELNPDNREAIERFGKIKTLFHVPYFKQINHSVLKTWVSTQLCETVL